MVMSEVALYSTSALEVGGARGVREAEGIPRLVFGRPLEHLRRFLPVVPAHVLGWFRRNVRVQYSTSAPELVRGLGPATVAPTPSRGGLALA